MVASKSVGPSVCSGPPVVESHMKGVWPHFRVDLMLNEFLTLSLSEGSIKGDVKRKHFSHRTEFAILLHPAPCD